MFHHMAFIIPILFGSYIHPDATSSPVEIYIYSENKREEDKKKKIDSEWETIPSGDTSARGYQGL